MTDPLRKAADDALEAQLAVERRQRLKAFEDRLRELGLRPETLHDWVRIVVGKG
jgi:hypothetical protein